MKKVRNLPTNSCHYIDFIALVRKVPLKNLDPLVKTFHSFAIVLTFMVTKAGHNCEEIYIICDTYRENCIKSERRGKSKEMVSLDLIET